MVLATPMEKSVFVYTVTISVPLEQTLTKADQSILLQEKADYNLHIGDDEKDTIAICNDLYAMARSEGGNKIYIDPAKDIKIEKTATPQEKSP